MFSVEITDLRNVTNYVIVSQKLEINEEVEVTLEGKVVSGLLFKPKTVSTTNKLPTVILKHGYLNNQEFQTPFHIELAICVFVVLAAD